MINFKIIFSLKMSGRERDSLNEHMRSYHNEIVYECNQCGHKANNKDEYEKHMKIHKTQNEKENNDGKTKTNEIIGKQKYIPKRIKC